MSSPNNASRGRLSYVALCLIFVPDAREKVTKSVTLFVMISLMILLQRFFFFSLNVN